MGKQTYTCSFPGRTTDSLLIHFYGTLQSSPTPQRQMNYLLPQRLPTAFLSLANMPSSPPVLATLSFRGDPSAMYLAPSCSNLHAEVRDGEPRP